MVKGPRARIRLVWLRILPELPCKKWTPEVRSPRCLLYPPRLSQSPARLWPRRVRSTLTRYRVVLEDTSRWKH